MRTLYIGTNSYEWVMHRLANPSLRRSHTVITPTRLAARSLQVPSCQLKTLAYQTLLPHYHLVPRLKAQQLLRAAVETTAPKNLEGTTRVWMPAIQELLQASPSLPESEVIVSPRISQLIQVTKTYQALLRDGNWVDPHEAYWRSLEHSLERRSLLIYGYVQLRADELAFIEAIADEQSILMLPWRDHPDFKEIALTVECLEEKGWTVESDDPGEHPDWVGQCLGDRFLDVISTATVPVINEAAKLYIYNDLEQEVRGTLAQIKDLWVNHDVSPRDIAIVAGEEVAYGDKLLDIAWEYGIPLRLLYDIPLNTTRLGAWLSLMMDVVEAGFPFEKTARLLSHPLSSDPDKDMWGRVCVNRPKNLAEWNAVFQPTLGIDLAVLDFPFEATRAEWLQRMRQLLYAFDLRRTCNRWARENLAYSKLDRSWKEVATPINEVLTRERFFRELQELMAIAQVSVHPARGGVELHGPTAVIGSRYRYLFVVGMAEGILPTPIYNDPVLDFHERKVLQTTGLELPTAAALARQNVVNFYHLLQTVMEHVVLSYNRLNGRQEYLPSPYTERLELTETTLPEFPITSLQELRKVVLQNQADMSGEDTVLVHARHAWVVEVRRESNAPHDAYDGVTGISIDWQERSFSVSQLTRLGLCPFSWFAQKVLRLEELEEEESSLAPNVRGNLYHKTLEILFKEATGDRTHITNPAALRTAFLQAEQDSDFNFSNLTAWDAQREEHLKTLSRVVQGNDFYPERAKAIALEACFVGEWKGFPIKGYVDRIDRTDNGLVLIDYKTSSTPPSGVKDADGKATVDLQLSVYKEAAAPVLFPGESVIDAYYYSLTKGKKLKDLKKLPSDVDLEAVAIRCQNHLSKGNFPVLPDIDNKACTYCAYDLVCRKGKRLDRKSAIAIQSADSAIDPEDGS
ncbi:PD-(D/E)XK nuclease family protein [Vacuolonema iberomarrocanum]|uniref:PD-(D/E)XK nuclease family protein n=1 Tax=Vacuolonema iberomarrocanum TaxID=3454632 RepID=UPI001A0BC4BD|nr:PD-(D/E)XK nuclease family protein [filamentous cyanobacterium LEGE 07170]